MSSPLPEPMQELVDLFAATPDRNERAHLLIELADRFQEVPERIARRPFPEEHRVQRCESEAYVWVEPLGGGTVKFHFAVENPQGLSAKAMAVLLDEAMSGRPAAEMERVPQDLPFEFFGRSLSMGKGQGLVGMVSLAKFLAARVAKQAGPEA